ncbi:hypothetical protein [[Mycobacterium] appelbergii]|uniref:hypothetical protein n=1 Tax=[Mycobacterium] appelbergii TaxID=2939269 RepID=UPI0029394931|nr:hypothetical protein [Mycobacterium sp. 21AC1]
MAAPMSIASTPELVTACCRAGVIGCFPTHNAWKASSLEHGLDPDQLPPLDAAHRPTIPRRIKPWRMILSGGHSVAGITDVPSVADLVTELERQFLG